jgi:TonB-dependent receptor
VGTDEHDPDLFNQIVQDTSDVSYYGRWFPMAHLRIRPTSFFDVRLAFTKSLSRPRLDWLIPKRNINGSARVATFGVPGLLPQISTNYDVFLSLYSNTIGLFTFGGFYKKIDDLIFEREGHKILDAQAEGYDRALQGYTVDKPENNAYKTEVKGFEIEWQTNLRWLPSPFDGIVINANYSHLWSETTFPRSFVVQEKIPVFPFVSTSVIDTFRTGKMPDQADDIANISIGYDKGPFSMRVSMLYQGRTLSSVGERPEMDGFTADLLRWDVSAKVSITRNLSLFFSFNNVTNEPDESFQQATKYITASEFYGWTSDIGIGYQFN